MKKIMMMIALLAVPFAMQAQKFHDVEANEAKGNVKSISMDMMGMTQTINFSEDGKMSSAEITNAVYDENGYILSANISIQGMSAPVKYEWENGRVKSRTVTVNGNVIKTIRNYDENGVVTSEGMDMGGNVMEIPYSDYKYDDKGNWISRKTSMMGQEMTTSRTITYY